MNHLLFSIFILLFLYSDSSAQKDSLQREINEQVWKAFIKSFNNNEDAGFKAVHSKDIIRVMQDNNGIIGYDEYFKPVLIA